MTGLGGAGADGLVEGTDTVGVDGSLGGTTACPSPGAAASPPPGGAPFRAGPAVAGVAVGTVIEVDDVVAVGSAMFGWAMIEGGRDGASVDDPFGGAAAVVVEGAAPSGWVSEGLDPTGTLEAVAT